MNHSRTIISATALLLGAGLSLSACAAVPDYNTAAYPNVYSGYAEYPYDDAFGLDFGGYRYFHDHRNIYHGHDGHIAMHVGHGFGRFGGHGFAGHGGFSGHGGGGHR
jgi:hypothetical protein